MYDYEEYLVLGFSDGEECASFSTLAAAVDFIDGMSAPGNFTVVKIAAKAIVEGDNFMACNPYLAGAYSYIVTEE